MIQTIISSFKNHFELKEQKVQNDGLFKKKGMTFRISAYDFGDTGRIAVIDMKSFLSIMKMESVIITTSKKDMPLYSADYIKAMGKHTLLAEFDNTMIEELGDEAQKRFEEVKWITEPLKEYEAEERWYSSIKYGFSCAVTGKEVTGVYKDIIKRYTDTFIDVMNNQPDVNREEKIARTREYVDNLFRFGGPAVDMFRKMFGEDVVKPLFYRDLFAVE